MRMCLCIVLMLIGCSNHKSSSDQQLPTDLSSTKVHSNLQDERKIELVETILNLPDVIRFSKLEFIRKKYGKIYILLKDDGSMDSVPAIMQNGQLLNILNSSDSIADNKPCYVFDKIELRDNSAYVRMTFDITGAIAFGNLNYIDKRWVPDNEFMVGVR